jgi:hypothetical protein
LDEANTTRSKCSKSKVLPTSTLNAQTCSSSTKWKIFDSQTKALDRLRIDPTCSDWKRRFFRRYHRLCFSHRHDRAGNSWNGTINPNDIQSLLGSHSQLSLSFLKFQEFRKRLVHFVSPLTEAAISMDQLQRQSRIRALLHSLPASSIRLFSVPCSITRPPLHPAFRPKSPAPPTPQPRPEESDLTAPPQPRRLTRRKDSQSHSQVIRTHQVLRSISQL